MHIDPKASPLLQTSLGGVPRWKKGKVRDVYDLGGTVGMPHHMLRPEDPLREGLQVHRTIGVSRPIAPFEL